MISDALIDALADAVSANTQLPEFPAGIAVADAYQSLPELVHRV